MANMELKEQIDQIISTRKEKGAALTARKESLKKLRTILKDNCAQLIAQARSIQDEALRSQYMIKLANMDSKPILRQIDTVFGKMNDGIKRFSRDYISIATVGKERQGKSQFLQSVGNLGNSIIPAYDGTSCTGSTSIIWNSPEMEKDSVRVTVHFRQPGELLEFVKTYIQEIDPEYLEDNTLEFDEIGYIKNDLDSLEEKISTGNADQAVALKHLTSIVENFDDIKDLFGSPDITLSDPELIKTYVAQNNGKTDPAEGGEMYYKYLAVSKADIYCPFYADVGKIRLVDTVGIGDTKHGIEDAMLNTVDQECDAAIVVTMPISAVQEPDIKLYNSLRNKFKSRDTSKWLFYLANHWLTRNDHTVNAFAQEILKSNWAVADCRVINAHDQNAVRDNFVLPMLDTLINNMEEIDGAYLQEINDQEAAVYAELKKFLERLPVMEPINISVQQGLQTYQKGLDCFNKMTANLKNQVNHWGLEKEKTNSLLGQEVQKILNDIDSITPTAEQIQELSNQNGALLGEQVWAEVLHYVRNVITDRFIAIDNVLAEATLNFKNSLVKVLYTELRDLSPSGSAQEDGETEDMVQWLKTMMDTVLRDDERFKQIYKAFNFLYQFEFNTRAQLIQEVRRQLYIINPICKEYVKPTENFQLDNCGESIHFYLTSRMAVIEDELRYHLSKLYQTPNQAFYAAAEEFYDRLTFANTLSEGALNSMANVWGLFFQTYASKIWKADTERYVAVNQLVVQYNQMITDLTAYLPGGAA